jgi:hypothetical protein
MQQPQGPFLFELEGLGWRRAHPADPAPQFGDLRAHAGLGQHPQAERQRRGADVVAPLDRQRVRDRRQVVIAELAVGPGQPGRRRGPANRREQAQHVPVPEHSR